MRPGPVSIFLLRHTRELVGAILDRPGYPADLTMRRYLGERKYLGGRDRRTIASLVFHTLRNVIRFDTIIDRNTIREEDEDAAFVALALLDFDALPDDEELTRGLGLHAGRIRSLRTSYAAFAEYIVTLPRTEQLALRHSIPLWLVDILDEEIGEEIDDALRALNSEARTTLRANTLLCTREQLAAVLGERGIETEPGELAPEALYSEGRFSAGQVPQFKSGWFELQDEGSQLLGHAVDPRPNWRLFDACAGAGGKALHLAALMRGRGEIVAHDISERRMMEMRPRLRRSGAQNIRVMQHDAYLDRREEMLDTFDAVVIDAPCSGVGTLRRNPGLRLTLTPDTVRRVAEQQRIILNEYAELVRPGGRLFYMTCSLLRIENEEQVDHFLDHHPDWNRAPLAFDPSLLNERGELRLWPHRHHTDGFFCAALVRGAA